MSQKLWIKPIKTALLGGLVLFFCLLSRAALLSAAENSAPGVGDFAVSSERTYPDEEVIFTATYVDPDGWQDILYPHLFINSNSSGSNCFFGYYNPDSKKLYLADDEGLKWLGGFAPGARDKDDRERIIENSYCRLNCTKSRVKESGNNLTVTWSVSFKPCFTGCKKTSLLTIDRSKTKSGRVYKEDICILRRPIAPPEG